MINKVKETIEKYNLIKKNEKVVLGVSGGPDSLSLLYVLKALGYDIVVCHVNHGLRKNGDLDEAFVKKTCKELEVPIYVKKLNLKDKASLKGMSTEEAGRKGRYDFFNSVAKKTGATKIATAHNLNDNVETVLLNMFRGSGVTGLKGIEPISKNIIRPLIECERKEIEEYCKKNKLKPRHDESNDKTIYTRNKVRLELIPYLEKNINSNVTNTIMRLSQIVTEQENYIDKVVLDNFEDILVEQDSNYKECASKEYNLAQNKYELKDDFYEQKFKNACVIYSLKKFNNLEQVIKKRLVLKAILYVLGNTKDIGKVHVDDIVKMCENNVGGKFLTPNKNIKISVKNKKIYFEKI